MDADGLKRLPFLLRSRKELWTSLIVALPEQQRPNMVVYQSAGVEGQLMRCQHAYGRVPVKVRIGGRGGPVSQQTEKDQMNHLVGS
jgi:hypothetical protein